MTAPVTPAKPTRIFTFGFGQEDPITGEDLGNKYAIVEGDWASARDAMFLSCFGSRFAFDYDNEEAAGVVRWNMRIHAYVYADGQVLRANEVAS